MRLTYTIYKWNSGVLYGPLVGFRIHSYAWRYLDFTGTAGVRKRLDDWKREFSIEGLT